MFLLLARQNPVIQTTEQEWPSEKPQTSPTIIINTQNAQPEGYSMPTPISIGRFFFSTSPSKSLTPATI